MVSAKSSPIVQSSLRVVLAPPTSGFVVTPERDKAHTYQAKYEGFEELHDGLRWLVTQYHTICARNTMQCQGGHQ